MDIGNRFKNFVDKAKDKKKKGAVPRMDMADTTANASASGPPPGGIPMPAPGGVGYDDRTSRYVEITREDLRSSMQFVLQFRDELDILARSIQDATKAAAASVAAAKRASQTQSAADSFDSLMNASYNTNNNNNTQNDTMAQQEAAKNEEKSNANSQAQITKLYEICDELENILQPYYSNQDHLSNVVNSMDENEFGRMLDEISKTDNKDPVSQLERGASDSQSDNDLGQAPPLRSQLSELLGSFDSQTNNPIGNQQGNPNNTVSQSVPQNLAGNSVLGGGGGGSGDFDAFDMFNTTPANNGKSSMLKSKSSGPPSHAPRQSTMDNFWNSMDAMAAVDARDAVEKKNNNTNNNSNNKNNNNKNNNNNGNRNNNNGNNRNKPQMNKAGSYNPPSQNNRTNRNTNNNKNNNNNRGGTNLRPGPKRQQRPKSLDSASHQPKVNLLTDTEQKRANKVAKERYDQIQAQFRVEEKERKARQQAFDDHGDRINDWEFDAKGVRRNLRTLLTKLPTVLWENSGWKPITLANLVSENHVKKQYRLACKLVHPDRSQQRGDSVERKAICERIFEGLNAAWDAEFSKK